jgi:hypothetical protein
MEFDLDHTRIAQILALHSTLFIHPTQSTHFLITHASSSIRE